MADCVRKGRHASGRVNPNFHGIAKLTVDDVAEIRATYITGRGEQKLLAAYYGVSESTICRVLKGKVWKKLLTG